MKLLSFQAKYTKRIKGVMMIFKPHGLTLIGGDNDQGKTSVLDILTWLWGGEKYRPSEILNGDAPSNTQPYMETHTDTGIHIERKGKNSSLKVWSDDGASGNQTFLDQFISPFAINFPAFRKLDPKGKANFLTTTLGIDKQLKECEDRIAETYQERRDAKREHDRTQTVFMSTPQPPKEIQEEVDVVKVSKEIQDATNKNNARDTEVSRQSNLINAFDEAVAKVEDLKRQVVLAEQQAANLEEQVNELTPIPDEIDISPLQARLEASQATNQQRTTDLNTKEKWETAKAENDAAVAAAGKAESALLAARAEKAELFNSIELPDPDLSIEGGELLYQGQQWDLLSGKQKIFICTSIVCALNKEARFMLVDGLEELGPDAIQEYDDMLTKLDIQCIGTQVTVDKDACTFFIEDGEIKETTD